jgi:tetratricopeptide (TPR) repeat protein
MNKTNEPFLPLSAEELFEQGNEAISNGKPKQALEFYQQAVILERAPLYLSTLAFCLAKETGDMARAIALCKEAIKTEPKSTFHYLQLGKIHVLAGEKKDAIRIYRLGLRIKNDQILINELSRLGVRSTPPISFLDRSNPINKLLGKLRKKMQK